MGFLYQAVIKKNNLVFTRLQNIQIQSQVHKTQLRPACCDLFNKSKVRIEKLSEEKLKSTFFVKVLCKSTQMFVYSKKQTSLSFQAIHTGIQFF